MRTPIASRRFRRFRARLSASFHAALQYLPSLLHDCDPLLLLAIVRSVAFELLWDDACDALSGLAGRLAEDDFKAEFSRRSFGSGLIGAWLSCAAGLPPIASETAPAVTSRRTRCLTSSQRLPLLQGLALRLDRRRRP